MVQKKSVAKKSTPGQSDRSSYWPYWLLLLLIAILLLLFVKSSQRADHINKQLNADPVSTKE